MTGCVAFQMSIPAQLGAPAAWAPARFGAVALGDKRRTARVVALAAGWALQPRASIPRLVGGSYAAKVAYGLLAWPTVPPDALQAIHRQRMHQARVCGCTRWWWLCLLALTRRRRPLGRPISGPVMSQKRSRPGGSGFLIQFG